MARSWVLATIGAGCLAACGGTVVNQGASGDHPDSGTATSDGGQVDSSANGAGDASSNGGAGRPCVTDDDCGTGLVCELDRCTAPGSVVYPTTAAAPLSTTFPETCFAPDLGLLEVRLDPPEGQTSFGRSVLLGQNRLVVGTSTGAQTYMGDGVTWTKNTFIALPSDATISPSMLAGDGDTIAIGAAYVGPSTLGVVYTYTLGPNGVVSSEEIAPRAPADFPTFGSSVALARPSARRRRSGTAFSSRPLRCTRRPPQAGRSKDGSRMASPAWSLTAIESRSTVTETCSCSIAPAAPGR